MNQQQAAAENSHDAGKPRTQVPGPSHRIFLPQPWSERVACTLWAIVRVTLFRFSPPNCNRWRVMLLRLFRSRVDWSAKIHPTVRIDFPWNLFMGKAVVVAHKVIINCMGEITIDDETHISQYAHLCAGTHDYRDVNMPILRKPIRIGKKVWIAADAFVGPGVSIGDGALLAARSSAFSDLPAGQVCVGEPARPQRERFEVGPTDS